ncbi:hypothetical protein POM88_015826 [Heracleum sosnowskyi]|uniref:Uncharacterized protein n=1 Tax=Heracleum sosnowskyi TaxID=360622 RepID=A0AAD8MXU4_9APIA|nr:hypothetical protein POM88_015826 [Heracleum sosnowskyi]
MIASHQGVTITVGRFKQCCISINLHRTCFWKRRRKLKRSEYLIEYIKTVQGCLSKPQISLISLSRAGSNQEKATMTTRIAARYVSRRLSSSGKILSEEEKAAENIYIKKMEKDKLDKLARKNTKPEEKPAGSSGDSGSVSDAKLSK